MFFVLFLLDYILEEFLLWCLNLFEHLGATVFSDDRLESIFLDSCNNLFFYSLNSTEEKKLIFIVEAMISGLEDIEVVIIILKALIIFLMMYKLKPNLKFYRFFILDSFQKVDTN